ncbi:MAG: tetratricopeptide repeat protein [Planctomycetia bacterium]|nr:tetratricopeptide repeat protein [Planctomycetia bacterium]
MNVGIAHARSGAFAEAVDCFQKATRLDPASVEIRQLLERARAAARAQPQDVPKSSSGPRSVHQILRS